MADEGIKDFTLTWILSGLLVFSMLTFAILFMYKNNPIGLQDDMGNLNRSLVDLQSNLLQTSNESNILLNISSNTNPEVGDLGSRDSVSSSFGIYGTGKGFFTSIKILIGWIFTGAMGQMLIGVFGGMIGFLGLYYITKFIRSGN